MLFGRKKLKALNESLTMQSGAQSYWSIVRKQFRKNRLSIWSLRLLYVLFFIALFGNFIANEKPIYAKKDGVHLFPVFKEIAVNFGLSKWSPELIHADWQNLQYESVLRTPIPYDSNKTDLANIYKGPFDKQDVASKRFRHWLGTDDLGRDVLSGMIHGTRVAMSVGFVVMGIATLIGLLFGAFAGYFGDDRLRLSKGTLFMNLIGFIFAIYYAFMVRRYALLHGESLLWELILSICIFAIIMFLFNLLAKGVKMIPWLNQKITVATDLIIMRIIEIMDSVPGLFFLLAAIPLFRTKSIFNVMILLGLISWPSIARFVRGELVRVRSMNYVEAAQVMGFKESRIVLRHALPNSLTPVLIAIAFGVAAAILAESGLSFLGIGVDPNEATWGQLLAKGRAKNTAWWLTVFPGLAIFLTVTIFNLIGEGLTDALDPKQKQ